MIDVNSLNILLDKDGIKILLLVVSIIIIFGVILITKKNLEKSIEKIQFDLLTLKKSSEVQNTYTSQFNDHIGLVDRKLKNLEEIVSITSRDISSMAEGITGEVGDGKAIELARRGATVDEILESSNVRRDQAELIVKFHGTQATLK